MKTRSFTGKTILFVAAKGSVWGWGFTGTFRFKGDSSFMGRESMWLDIRIMPTHFARVAKSFSVAYGYVVQCERFLMTVPLTPCFLTTLQ